MKSSPQAVLPQDNIQLLRDLRQALSLHGLERSIKVGQVVLEGVYGGNVSVWRARGRKDVSLRKLAQSLESSVGASQLWKAVAIYVWSIRRPELIHLRWVRPSHLNEVLALTPDDQDRLTDAAERSHWPVRRLRAEVLFLLGRGSSVTSQERIHRFFKAVHRLGRDVDGKVFDLHDDDFAWIDAGKTQDAQHAFRRFCQYFECSGHRFDRRRLQTMQVASVSTVEKAGPTGPGGLAKTTGTCEGLTSSRRGSSLR
jgi:hypothetical protein